MVEQRIQSRLMGLAASAVLILETPAFLKHILWLVPVTMAISILTSAAAYLKLKAFWAKTIALLILGTSLLALCLTPSLFAAFR